MDQDPQVFVRQPVLYVEDHPVNVMLMTALFERRPGLKLVVAGSGVEALCLATGLNPALLLLDLRLPDCHGSHLLPLLRQMCGCESVPAVAVTAEDDFDITGTGFCEVWTKPLNLAHVLDRLDQFARAARKQAAAALPPPQRQPSRAAAASLR